MATLHGECSICCRDLAHFSPPCVTKCGHAFHTACVTQWLETQKRCPTCNAATAAGVVELRRIYVTAEQDNNNMKVSRVNGVAELHDNDNDLTVDNAVAMDNNNNNNGDEYINATCKVKLDRLKAAALMFLHTAPAAENYIALLTHLRNVLNEE